MDLPTLGIPTTMARMGRFKMPRFLSRSIFSLQASWTTAWICFKVPLFLASIFTTCMPRSVNHWAQRRFKASSARSALFSSTMRAFPAPRSSMSGLRLESGTRASTSSITRSMSFKSSFMARLAFVICPGYHCIFILNSPVL